MPSTKLLLQIAPNHYFRARTWWPGDLYTVNEVGSKLKEPDWNAFKGSHWMGLGYNNNQ